MAFTSENKIELLICGYLRDYMKNNPLFPMDLAHPIFKLFPREKFKFMDPGNNFQMTIDEDGSSAVYNETSDEEKKMKKVHKWVVLQVGHFFAKNDKIIHKLRFKFEEHPGFTSIGFITKEFNLWKCKDWNSGNNGSVLMCNNGYFTTSAVFDTYMPRKNVHSMYFFRDKDDETIMKIDTSNMKALLWNATYFQNDLEFDKEYPSFKKHYMQFDLPKTIPIALAIELGREQKVKIISHDVAYL